MVTEVESKRRSHEKHELIKEEMSKQLRTLDERNKRLDKKLADFQKKFSKLEEEKAKIEKEMSDVEYNTTQEK